MSRQQLLGDMFYAGGLGYYAQLSSLAYIMGLESGNHFSLRAGMGTIGYEPEVNTGDQGGRLVDPVTDQSPML